VIKDMEAARHNEERGAILYALRQEVGAEMTSVRTLAMALNLAGMPMTHSGLQFSLGLLADAGYVKIWRARDVGAWRKDRLNDVRPEAILFARLLPQGLALIDGKSEPDPNVSF